MKKRLLALAMAAAMTFSLAACGEKEKEIDPSLVVDETECDLTFWHVFVEDEKLEIIDNYIKEFNKAYPNVNVEQVYVNDEEYVSKLQVAAANGTQGDVFFSYGGGQAEPYVESGVVMPLDDYFEESGVGDKLLPGSLTYCTYDGKAYGIPLKQWAGVLFCNQKLFDEYDVEIPKTWDEFQSAIKTFKENGITPLALGAGDAWHVQSYQIAFAVRYAGPDAVNRMLNGEESFVNDDIIKSAQTVIDLNNEGAFTKNTLGYSAEEAEAEFYMGNVAMFYGGSWSCAEIDKDGSGIQGNCTVTYLPTVPGGKGDETTYSGGVIDFLMVNQNTKNPDIALAFASGIAEYMSAEFYKIGDSLPAWKVEEIDESEVSPTLLAIQQLTENATGYVLAWDTVLDSSLTEVHYNLCQGLISGEVSAEEFAEGMQTAMEEYQASK